ncbi:MAG: hypothetical protein ACYDAS_01055 [Patescibacteria group bacterium]
MKRKLPEIILTRLLALIVEPEVTKHSFDVYAKAKTFLLRPAFPCLLSEAYNTKLISPVYIQKNIEVSIKEGYITYTRKKLFEIPLILTSVTS